MLDFLLITFFDIFLVKSCFGIIFKKVVFMKIQNPSVSSSNTLKMFLFIRYKTLI